VKSTSAAGFFGKKSGFKGVNDQFHCAGETLGLVGEWLEESTLGNILQLDKTTAGQIFISRTRHHKTRRLRLKKIERKYRLVDHILLSEPEYLPVGKPLWNRCRFTACTKILPKGKLRLLKS
jgi:hypothetical protein